MVGWNMWNPVLFITKKLHVVEPKQCVFTCTSIKKRRKSNRNVLLAAHDSCSLFLGSVWNTELELNWNWNSMELNWKELNYNSIPNPMFGKNEN